MNASSRPSLWRRIGNSWNARGKKPGAVDLAADGLVFTQGRHKTQIRWDEVTQIDAGVRDTLSIDLFFVVLQTPDAKVTIDEFDDGFRVLEQAIFEHWADLRGRWVALQCGPLHQPHFETLWRR